MYPNKITDFEFENIKIEPINENIVGFTFKVSLGLKSSYFYMPVKYLKEGDLKIPKNIMHNQEKSCFICGKHNNQGVTKCDFLTNYNVEILYIITQIPTVKFNELWIRRNT